jgi:UDP-N-acetylmuramate--alanine ligase
VWAAGVAATPGGSTFTVDGVPFTVPTPGRHDVLNALAALAACRETGLGLADMAGPLAGFGGVARRFNVIGTAGGVTVIDDFAHNPDKIAAALETARDRAGDGRVLAMFQPHGFGPTRFLREALVATFAAALRDRDVLWLPEIYYAGGTVTRDVSSGDLVAAVRAGDRDARFVPERGDLTAAVAAEARPGDVVLVMGARDPSLTDFCRGILARLG